MGYLTRPAAAADRPGVLALFPSAFGAGADPEEWRWKYDRNPFQAASIVAVEGERVLGFYGGFATRYRGAEGSLPGVSAVDVMTDPDARSLGHRNVFRQIGETYARANAALGIPFYFGFPNERHRHVGERLIGYRPVEPAGERARSIPAAGFVGRLRRRLFRVRVNERFGRSHESLAEILHARGGWRTDRSAATMSWRFFERPNVAYQVVELRSLAGRSRGFAAVRIVSDRALLVDLQLADESSGDLGDLLDAVSVSIAGGPARTLEVRSPSTLLLARRLTGEMGFVERASDCHFEVRPLDPGFDLERAARSFDYRFSDHDVF
ncbi:MAG TPA: GNAT family N-acetyltransferase [Thermoanaerobaculia bacterium]|nr:GNAT family N-acetyltransferase [Thermoanaerobaculia bacterium]